MEFKKICDFCKIWAASLIIIGALACTLLAKLYWAIHVHRLGQYPGWIVADLIVLVGAELFCSLTCFSWQKNWAARVALVFAALVCTWSVINAGWLIATGTQALPAVIAPLFFDPVSRFRIVGHHLAMRPFVAVALLGPSAIALAFFFTVLKKPIVPPFTKKHIQTRLIIYIILLIAAGTIAKLSLTNADTKISAELRYNSQFKAIKSIFVNIRRDNNHRNLQKDSRILPLADETKIPLQTHKYIGKYNLVMVVLEGIAPGQTKFLDPNSANVPFLASLGNEGVSFTNCRTVATHTTKALFAIHTGEYPSVSQDYIEASVREKNYRSIATILKSCGYRTAFFQSADGIFEARPGLVNNLGFEKFFARQDIADANSYLGYLAADEFELIQPVCDWIKQSDKPFMLTILGSASHDPYEIPDKYKDPNYSDDDEPEVKYRRLIEYTDAFLADLYKKLGKVTNMDKTIFCVIGDHGEAFGQHDRYGHARIPYDEVLKVFWFIKSPKMIKRSVKIDTTVSSIDVTPTLLNLLGFDITEADFDGINALAQDILVRKLFFSTWMKNGPAGFMLGREKFIYDTTNEMMTVFDLSQDPAEINGQFFMKNSADMAMTADKVINWQRQMLITPPVNSKEEYQRIFDNWLCQTNSREPRAVYDKIKSEPKR
ncbi:MAG: LTA synthase family protein [Phycisphaerae bacterium]